jgi:hypothetical protein
MVVSQKQIVHILVFLITLYFVSLPLAGGPYTKQTLLINCLTDSLKKIPTDSSRLSVNKQIEHLLDSLLINDDSFFIETNAFKHIGIITAPDRKFRLITWNVPFNNGKHRYFGRVQLKSESDTVCRLIQLIDSSNNFQSNITDMVFSKSKWYGALYYEIICEKIGSDEVYILLGIHFNDLFTNRKIIESLYFNTSGDIIFGKTLFVMGNHTQKRVVFDYTIKAVMSLTYDVKLKMIVFDHLAPPSPFYSGNYSYYGPDFTFDGFKFEKNKWVFYPNINFHQ